MNAAQPPAGRRSLLFGPWPPVTFIVIVCVIIVLTRALVIVTSHDDRRVDLPIYQEVGELVVNGVDPYDFSSKRALRDSLRTNDYGTGEGLKDRPAEYDYYVSGNLPGSTLLYGLLQLLSGGSTRIWRLALATGDVCIALAAFFMLRRAGVALDTRASQTAFALLAIYSPSSIQWGLLIPEDKQFQTALMLLLAGLMLKPLRAGPAATAGLAGMTGALSVIYKAFGLFLAPLAVHWLLRQRLRDILLFAIAGAVTIVPFLLWFDGSFIPLMMKRLLHGSSSLTEAMHGSPWHLAPAGLTVAARPLICAGLVALVAFGALRRQLDLLNTSASLGVIFVCLWIQTGSMDRMNIAMMFAAFCLATMSLARWQQFVWFNFAVQLVIYATVIARTNWFAWFNPETPDAIATAVFVVSYFGLLGTIMLTNSSPGLDGNSGGD